LPFETRENAQLLLDYCTRKLEPESVAALERHIAICGACREFASASAVWQALDAWEAGAGFGGFRQPALPAD
jgi:hypothetical protein